jgi:hypothetical protein
MIGLSYFAIQPVFAVYALAFYGIVMSRIMKKYYPEKDNKGPILARLFRQSKIRLMNLRTGNNELVDKQ